MLVATHSIVLDIAAFGVFGIALLTALAAAVRHGLGRKGS